LFNAVMLRSLPVSHPEQLVFFHYVRRTDDNSTVRRISSGYYQGSLPYATYEAFRHHARTLVGVFVFVSSGTEGNGLTVDVGGRPMTADGEMVTGSYFSVLGVSPVRGRAIVDSDLNPGSPNVAVISHKFWLREFGGELSAVGRGITVNGVPFTIVGVAPPGFGGLSGAVPDLWFPLRPTPALRPWGSQAASTESIFADRRYWWCTIGGRLKPGVTQTQVLAETEYLFRQSITAGLNKVPQNLLLFEIDPERSGYKAERGVALHQQLLERIQELPDVRAVTFSQIALLSGQYNTSPTATDGAFPPRQNEVHYNRVGPRFFETMGMRVLLGRGIGLRDADASHPTAVVNESWARSYFPNENPVGHRISVGGEKFKPEEAYEIVGVAEDANPTLTTRPQKA
jgi:hypothetical protein